VRDSTPVVVEQRLRVRKKPSSPAAQGHPVAHTRKDRELRHQGVLDKARSGLHTAAIMPRATDEHFRTLYSELMLEFMAELMTVTQGATTDTALQRALQDYVEELRPWLNAQDAPSTPRPAFSLFTSCEMTEGGEMINVVLSPEGEAVFRAWVRRQAVVSATARSQEAGWEQ
jgi:hypothetical protein